MLKSNLGLEMVGRDIVWCFNRGLLHNTRSALETNRWSGAYSRAEIRGAFADLLNELFESEQFVNWLKAECDLPPAPGALKAEAQKETTINGALEDDIDSLNCSGALGVDLLYSLMCDIIPVIGRKGRGLASAVALRSDELLPEVEFMQFRVFSTVVKKIVKNAVKSLENTRDHNIKMDGQWQNPVGLDAELVFLLNYGSASGIFNRIRASLSTVAGFHEESENYDPQGPQATKATLMCELARLPVLVCNTPFRSRQIVFTRVLHYLARLLTHEEGRFPPYLPAGDGNRVNTLLWNLLYSAIVESEIPVLYHNDPGIIDDLYKLRARGLNVTRLCLILRYRSGSYVGELCDYESVKSEVEAQHYFEKRSIAQNVSHFGKMMHARLGVTHFESGVLNA